MNQSAFFRRLGAPLKNPRWSWGSVRKDGIVFLRVWKDQIKTRGGVKYVRLACNESDDSRLGYRERLKHIRLVSLKEKSKKKHLCYLVICTAKEIREPRRIKDFDAENLYSGGQIAEFDKAVWIELRSKEPVKKIALPKRTGARKES